MDLRLDRSAERTANRLTSHYRRLRSCGRSLLSSSDTDSHLLARVRKLGLDSVAPPDWRAPISQERVLRSIVVGTARGCRGHRAPGCVHAPRRRSDGRRLLLYFTPPGTRCPRQRVARWRAGSDLRAEVTVPVALRRVVVWSEAKEEDRAQARSGGHERNTATRRSARAPIDARSLPQSAGLSADSCGRRVRLATP